MSSVYETDPIGLAEQPAYLNAVAALDTRLAAEDLLDRLLEVEARHGRVRTVRFGPRTLDLDLIAYAGERRTSERLTLPHPRAHEREFVLRPLAEIAPELELGGVGAAERLAALPPQGVRRTELVLR